MKCIAKVWVVCNVYALPLTGAYPGRRGGLGTVQSKVPSLRGPGAWSPWKILNYAFNLVQSGTIWEQN